MNELEVTEDLAKSLGLSGEDWVRICVMLNRRPTYTELGIFSVMWSEHVSYKSSRLHLKRNFGLDTGERHDPVTT